MVMGSNYATVGLSYLLLLMMAICVESDTAKDREECANQLLGLATCLPYVGGTAKSPTLDCCTGLKQVLDKSKKCLCVLVRDRNDPSLGVKINATLAMSLPDTCHASANVSMCPELLQLPPNSPDAKVFDQFANRNKGSSTVASGNPSSSNSASAQEKSDGGRGERRMLVEMVSGVWLCLGLALFFIIDVWK
ncbi:non-specific lipid transfer protein GPI-anchored 14-like isoform X2 [Telopea speciosissima]|uniref:non-specific lipid transfer protein GPI-anchored 14-like isoform X2 n=1 Tax=Telopea speciosissima TaxID=54955 RepID=UPI001CC368A9|nr:non-specific lipid transfer protein GPI-anchored 14-like isoform X2 [Telopea speciosissima]